MRRLGAEAYLFALSALALIGLLVLELCGHPGDETMRSIALAAIVGGAGVSTPATVRHMVTAAADVAEAAVAAPDVPSSSSETKPPAVPPFVDGP